MSTILRTRTAFRAAILAVYSMTTSAQQPGVLTRAPMFDFGTVKQGEKITHAFVVSNPGVAPVPVIGANFNVPGMTTRLKPAIRPGQEEQITIEWDTSGVKGKVRAEAVILLGGSAQSEVHLVLQGYVRPPLEILPMGALFFSVYQGDRADQAVTLVNHEERPMHILGIEPEGSHFAASYAPLKEGRQYSLKVSISPDTPPGRYMESVIVRTDHPQFAHVRVPVNVFVKTEVYVNPEVVDFGRVSLGTLMKSPSTVDLLSQTFLVKKRQGKFRIKSVTSGLPFLQISRSPNGDSETFQLDAGLVREQLRKGKIAGSIRILTTDSRFPSLEVPVRGEIY